MGVLKQTITALLPPGPLWKPKTGGDFDLVLDSLADEFDTTEEFLGDLACIRCPEKTPIFEDLEREYGIKPNSNVTDADRLARLERLVYQGEKIDSPDDLQDALNTAGFTDLQVHLNDPPVDPDNFLDENFQMVAGGSNAYAGYTDGVDILAFAGRAGGEWLVNPDIYLNISNYLMQANGDAAFAGNQNAVSGYFLLTTAVPLEYETPSSDYWPLTFFVGGDATRDPVTDELTNIELGQVPNERKDDLKTTILSIKPLMGWCGLVIEFT